MAVARTFGFPEHDYDILSLHTLGHRDLMSFLRDPWVALVIGDWPDTNEISVTDRTRPLLADQTDRTQDTCSHDEESNSQMSCSGTGTETDRVIDETLRDPDGVL